MFENTSHTVLRSILQNLNQRAKNNPTLCHELLMAALETLDATSPTLVNSPITKIINNYDLTQTEIDYILAGKKIMAIKEVRARLGIGLKEAKDLCDIWDNAHQAKFEAKVNITPFGPKRVFDDPNNYHPENFSERHPDY